MNGIKKIVMLFVIWRVILFFPPLIFSHFISYRQGYEYTRIVKDLPKNSVFKKGALYIWSNFDGVHYLKIAHEGYTNNGRFLPLLPLLIYTFTFWTTSFELQYTIAWVLVQLVALGSLILFYKLLRLDYSSSQSFQAILFLLLFPTAFFLGSIYTEGLFLLLTVLSFYLIRQKKIVLSALSASLLPLTRVVGIAILPALIYELYQSKKRLKDLMVPVLPLLLIIVSLVGLSLYDNLKWQDPLYFIHAHTQLQNGRSSELVFIPQTVFRYLKILLTLPLQEFNWWVALLELSSFVFTCLMLIIAWFKKVRVSYIIFALGAFLIPTFSGTFTGLPRYILGLIPIYIALTLIKNNSLKIMYMVVAGILQILLLVCFSQGYYVA
jgi:Gpi18-like mannosyltransferase